MAELDERIVKVTLEIEDQFITYDGLAIRATGSKYASATQNETVIRIANIEKEERDFLATVGTPFNRINNRKRNKVIVEAGRQSFGTIQFFVGDITTVDVSQPPDIWTTIKAITSQFQKGEVVSRTQPALSKFSTIAGQVANDLGLSLLFDAEDKNISNYAFTGPTIGQVDKLSEMSFGVDAYVDDETLVVKNRNQPVQGRVRPVDIQNGLVGKPEFTDFGVKVTVLADKDTKVGDAIDLTSELLPAANGRYIIYKMGFDIANRDTPFYYILETRRPGGSFANGG